MTIMLFVKNASLVLSSDLCQLFILLILIVNLPVQC